MFSIWNIYILKILLSYVYVENYHILKIRFYKTIFFGLIYHAWTWEKKIQRKKNIKNKKSNEKRKKETMQEKNNWLP